MPKYDQNVSENSTWISVTPTPAALSMPFYITEIGRFFALDSYAVARQYHDSFLMLYTIGGEGTVLQGGNKLVLNAGKMVIIDCHAPHSYCSTSESWSFLWMHFSGGNMPDMYKLLYPNGICSLSVAASDAQRLMEDVLALSSVSSFIASSDISAKIHKLYSILLKTSAIDTMQIKNSSDYVKSAVNYIGANYSRQITVDDMLSDIPVSKFYFIRVFKSVTGITPYSYLLLHRISKAKELLRGSDKTVSEISALCGFLDVSNFIVQFKKLTGQKPLRYRQVFSSKSADMQ